MRIKSNETQNRLSVIIKKIRSYSKAWPEFNKYYTKMITDLLGREWIAVDLFYTKVHDYMELMAYGPKRDVILILYFGEASNSSSKQGGYKLQQYNTKYKGGFYSQDKPFESNSSPFVRYGDIKMGDKYVFVGDANGNRNYQVQAFYDVMKPFLKKHKIN